MLTYPKVPSNVGTMKFNDAQFGATEIERATGMPERTFELLKREKLLPAAISKPGRGRLAKYDFNGLGRFATIMAFSQVVEGVVPAARMANGIVPELEHIYGDIPFGMRDASRNLRGVEGLRGANGELMPFAVYREAVKIGLVDPEKAMSNDYRLLIVDGEFVFQAQSGDIKFPPQFEGDEGRFSPMFRLQKIGRAGGFRVEHINVEHVPTAQFYHERLEHAISMVQLNLSLSLRKTLSAIIESRNISGGTAE